jgi:FkbH-like protein
VNQFVSLARNRLRRQRDQAPLARLKDDAAYVAEVAAARVFLRRCTSVGGLTRTVGRPRVDNRGRMDIGTRTRLVSTFAPIELTCAAGATLRIGAHGAINFGTIISASRSVDIADEVSIGPYCILSDTEFGDVAAGSAGEAGGAEPIVLEKGVWLASRVTVLPGVTIGEGSVITAGSIVTTTIPRHVVAGGIPARVIRRLDGAGASQPNGQKASHASEPGTARGTNGARNSSANSLTLPSEDAPPPSETPVKREATHRGLLISDFTIDELKRVVELDDATPFLAAAVAPFDQIVPTLLAPKNSEHDYAVVWTRPEGALPSFARLLEFEVVDEDSLLAEVDRFIHLLKEGLKSYRFAFVPTWTLPPWRRGLGMSDAKVNGVTRALYAANNRLIAGLSDASTIFVLNAQRWCDDAGSAAYSAKLWYMGKVPFHTAVFKAAAADIKAAIQGLSGLSRKLVVVDLDDTLWGGIVGDVGWEHLRLGGHDSVGEAFVDFQRGLKSLKRRGVLLAMVSKNTESVALEAIRSHPEMILKEEDFVGWRINWQDKAKNVADLVASLNLGLQSTVFIDDNPFERARVREALPEVLVPDWPEDKLAYATTLSSLRCFDAPTRSTEDAQRTELYASDRKREAMRAEVSSLDDWLRRLELRVDVAPVTPVSLARTTQLLNKTNQLNLTTRRLTEDELAEWALADGHWMRTITVSDRLGSAGLTGIVSVRIEGSVAKIVDYVLSCRVMGRRVEETMVHLAVDMARSRSLTQVVADLIPTAKNQPCLEFWQRSGFRHEGENHFVWDTREPYPLPEAISVAVAQ